MMIIVISGLSWPGDEGLLDAVRTLRGGYGRLRAALSKPGRVADAIGTDGGSRLVRDPFWPLSFQGIPDALFRECLEAWPARDTPTDSW